MIRIAKTENGTVRGIEAADPRITAFKGIPFAAPPVGENRWRAPQPCKDWEGIREAYRFAPISMQDTPGIGDIVYNKEWHVDPEIEMSEDCLYLNVWTSARTKEEKQPVVIWFFGGGLQWGYPSEMEFDGERVARRGVVVVTVNYRINVFGFLAHPDLTKEAPDAPTNFGSLDQQAGIKWVIRNIREFGGDPENITIAGQSAGGGSVLSQMTCPDNFGMFQKAIIQSAMIRSPYGDLGVGNPEPLKDAEKNGEAFLHFLGVKTIEQARELDAFFIRDKYAEFAADHPRMFTVLDNKFCFGDALKLCLEGKYADVAIMAGNTADEFPSYIIAADEEEFKKKAEEIFGEDAPLFLKQKEAWEKVDNRYARVIGIEPTVKAVFNGIRRLQRGRGLYYYSFEAEIPGEDHPGDFHSIELWFFFETLAKCWRPFKGAHYDLARHMCNYWCNFIKTGDPNGPDADGSAMPEWKPYQDGGSMHFETDGARFEEQETEYMKLMIRKCEENLTKN